MEIQEIVKNAFEKETIRLQELSNKQLINLHKYFNIRIYGRSKYCLIKQLNPIKMRYRRVRQLEESNFTEECPVCYDTIKQNDYVITNCCHIFCQECMIRHVIIGRNQFCPYCRAKCKEKELFVLPLSNELLEKMGILKITPDMLDTGLFILENIRYQHFITDYNIIQLIEDYQLRQQNSNKIVIFIKFILMIIAIWILTTI